MVPRFRWFAPPCDPIFVRERGLGAGSARCDKSTSGRRCTELLPWLVDVRPVPTCPWMPLTTLPMPLLEPLPCPAMERLPCDTRLNAWPECCVPWPRGFRGLSSAWDAEARSTGPIELFEPRRRRRSEPCVAAAPTRGRDDDDDEAGSDRAVRWLPCGVDADDSAPGFVLPDTPNDALEEPPDVLPTGVAAAATGAVNDLGVESRSDDRRWLSKGPGARATDSEGGEPCEVVLSALTPVTLLELDPTRRDDVSPGTPAPRAEEARNDRDPCPLATAPDGDDAGCRRPAPPILPPPPPPPTLLLLLEAASDRLAPNGGFGGFERTTDPPLGTDVVDAVTANPVVDSAEDWLGPSSPESSSGSPRAECPRARALE